MSLDKIILNDIREILYSARNKVYLTANNAMVSAYFEIGKAVVENKVAVKKLSMVLN